MDYGAIATLIASGIALITSIATLIVNLCNQHYSELLKKRIFPTVSILNNSMDDFDTRIKRGTKDKYYRVFFDKNEEATKERIDSYDNYVCNIESANDPVCSD